MHGYRGLELTKFIQINLFSGSIAYNNQKWWVRIWNVKITLHIFSGRYGEVNSDKVNSCGNFENFGGLGSFLAIFEKMPKIF